MQITDFIDSKDIREYLKKIDYKFKSDEAAFVIWQSNNKSIEEKHKGYEWIIHNMPDVNLKERVPRAYREDDAIDSPQYHLLHYILKKIMETENMILSLLYRMNKILCFHLKHIQKVISALMRTKGYLKA